MIAVRILARVVRTVFFLLFFLWELIAANVMVVWEVITPRDYMRPGIIGVPILSRSDLEVTLLANFISLTPGTLSLEVSEDRSTLYVHALHIVTPDHLRRRVAALERHMLRVVRG